MLRGQRPSKSRFKDLRIERYRDRRIERGMRSTTGLQRQYGHFVTGIAVMCYLFKNAEYPVFMQIVFYI